jgi:uncharacterized protein (TIGR04255 family)
VTPLQLPEPADVPLVRSPLVLVVCQIRHDRRLAVAETRTGLAVQRMLGDKYPEIGQQHAASMEVVMGPGAGAPHVNHEAIPGGWRLQSDDGTWTVTLLPEAFSIETSSYSGWTDFRARLHDLVAAVVSTYAPELEQRIGLRYVDEIFHPEVSEPHGWKGWIDDDLLGPLAHPALAGSVRAAQQIVDFDAGGGHRVILRHGTSQVVNDQRWVYLLDHDCFRQAGREFNQDELMASADALHKVALQVFQAAVTPEMYAYLGPEGSK